MKITDDGLSKNESVPKIPINKEPNNFIYRLLLFLAIKYPKNARLTNGKTNTSVYGTIMYGKQPKSSKDSNQVVYILFLLIYLAVNIVIINPKSVLNNDMTLNETQFAPK